MQVNNSLQVLKLKAQYNELICTSPMSHDTSTSLALFLFLLQLLLHLLLAQNYGNVSKYRPTYPSSTHIRRQHGMGSQLLWGNPRSPIPCKAYPTLPPDPQEDWRSDLSGPRLARYAL